MSEYKLKLIWKNSSNSMDYKLFNRDHEWHFEGGITLKASSAPEYFGDSSLVDPEQAFVASISSCHMLTFLAICSKKKLVVKEYTDNPVGFLEKNDDGKYVMTRVLLKPHVIFDQKVKIPSSEEINKIHDNSHNHCFIANSVKTKILIIKTQ